MLTNEPLCFNTVLSLFSLEQLEQFERQKNQTSSYDRSEQFVRQIGTVPKIDPNSSLNKPEQFLTQIGTVPETNRDSVTGAYM